MNELIISIVIPAFNEEKRIGATLCRIHDFFKSKNYGYEVIVVSDGSSDGTIDVANRSLIARDRKIRILTNVLTRGKGYSVKKGIRIAKGKYVLFTDADLSTPIEEIEKFFVAISEGYDIIIGSRAIEEAIVNVRQPWYRQCMGKLFNLFVRVILGIKYLDTQCGFKLFTNASAKDLARALKIYGFSFDAEMLYIAKKRGYRVKEIGVLWNNSPESKVSIVRSPFSMFVDLFRIKWIHR
ncbi:glycosyl transferase family protein [Candidatus Omnitrophus magneticus]|uniref:dolichyl-phosphate beta-glucosyltransferase n=1 Tax=Candidatus Omnitrophus magneticus TaxID=1609969 RepID=A0A0F0CUW3_9BACT|nr:glycosyl transferase family protein [Candidatus Omnitrophus magneticus]